MANKVTNLTIHKVFHKHNNKEMTKFSSSIHFVIIVATISQVEADLGTRLLASLIIYKL